MRNNNIIIVKCFISSFAGEAHPSELWRRGWAEAQGEVGTWFWDGGGGGGGVRGGWVAFIAFISPLMTGDSRAGGETAAQ